MSSSRSMMQIGEVVCIVYACVILVFGRSAMLPGTINYYLTPNIAGMFLILIGFILRMKIEISDLKNEVRRNNA